MAVGECFRNGDHKHLVVIGKDTRLSGYMLEPALTAGFITMGMDVVLVGPLPTPAIAMLTRSLRADIGVVISASHNPFHDNGIKLFGRTATSCRTRSKRRSRRRSRQRPHAARRAGHLGRAKRLEDAGGRYIEFVKQSLPRRLRLDGLESSSIAPTAPPTRSRRPCSGNWAPRSFRSASRRTGSTSTVIAGRSRPSRCGRRWWRGRRYRHRARRRRRPARSSPTSAAILDGDQLMALIATSLARAGKLTGGGWSPPSCPISGSSAISPSNGIALHRTAVGDRYVVENMRQHGCNLGGEQSGHIILSDYSTTGDGLIAALQVLAAIVETGKPASEACRLFTPVPQLLRNVRFGAGTPLEAAAVKQAIAAGEARLGTAGRLLIRNSGTEPVIRVMAQGEDEALLARRRRRHLRGDPDGARGTELRRESAQAAE